MGIVEESQHKKKYHSRITIVGQSALSENRNRTISPEDPTTSPTINNNNSIGNNKSNQLNENSNGSLISTNNHEHYDIDDAHSVSSAATSNLVGSNSSGSGSSTTFSVPAEVLLKNFQDRLSTTQSKNTKLTDSQLEFFRLLDEKIERGQDYQPS
uniref:BESS domain-containing protein n=1 Tax=Romanomermis culicivorax TaxID=13658 RepID=A0A915JXX0_ROMCU